MCPVIVNTLPRTILLESKKVRPDMNLEGTEPTTPGEMKKQTFGEDVSVAWDEEVS